MSRKYNFQLSSQDHTRALPPKLIIGQQELDTPTQVLLKLLAYALFYRDRLVLDTNLHNDNIPFVPDLVHLDYEMRPTLWFECGDCTLSKLNKLAVKVPEATIWILKPSFAQAEELVRAMAKEELRRNRYTVIGFDEEMLSEMLSLLQNRNDLTWFKGQFEPPELQLEFNGLWFDAPFQVLKH